MNDSLLLLLLVLVAANLVVSGVCLYNQKKDENFTLNKPNKPILNSTSAYGSQMTF